MLRRHEQDPALIEHRPGNYIWKMFFRPRFVQRRYQISPHQFWVELSQRTKNARRVKTDALGQFAPVIGTDFLAWPDLIKRGDGPGRLGACAAIVLARKTSRHGG